MRLTGRAAAAAAMVLVATFVLVACGADIDTPTDVVDEPEEGTDGPIEAPHDDPRRHGTGSDRPGSKG
jgi:hypothetical protein